MALVATSVPWCTMTTTTITMATITMATIITMATPTWTPNLCPASSVMARGGKGQSDNYLACVVIYLHAFAKEIRR